ncbi:DNA polymerase II subunit B3-1 [Lactuca sativa]|nr:DNA polymerase II subunit B3-1 [Lactuca sativa]
MAKEQKAESGRSKKGETAPATAKANGKRKIKKNAEGDVQVEVPIVQSSSSNSHNHERNGVKSESFVEEQVEVSGKVDVVDDSVEAEEAMKSTEASKEEKKKEKAKEEEVKEDTHQKKKKKVKEEIDEKDSSSLYQIPMNRVSRIIKVEDPNVRITQEAVFIINKASEKFLQLFTTEAYASAFLDRKKHIGYKHLSSVVGKRRRFDFLSDFVPEKVKAEDALKETPAVET